MAQHQPERLLTGWRDGLIVLALWLPYGLIWFGLGAEARSIERAAAGALIHYLATVSGTFVVVLAVDRQQWPIRVSLPLIGAHLLAAITFAFWVLWSSLQFSSWWTGRNDSLGPLANPIVWTWNMSLNVSLYILIIAAAYGLRATRFERATREALVLEMAATQAARLAALRHQLQPHFLFNALHSVGALLKRSPDIAERALSQVAEILRYSLRDSDTASLKEEWRCLQAYLTLEQLRFGDELKVHLTLDERAAGIEVPLFTTQALAENAITHGLANRPGLGTLKITARIDSGKLVIEVEDDGLGAEAAGRDAPHGTGLSSLKTRLAALCGPQATLTLARSSGGSRAVVSIPIPSN